MTDWLLQAIREEIDREVIGEFVATHVERPPAIPVQRQADDRNPHYPLEGEW